MRLYLVRHGDAVSSGVDPARPLSAHGQKAVRRVARFISRADVHIGVVGHSGRRRAEQTAELLAEALGDGIHLEKLPGLDPDDSTDEFAHSLRGRTKDLLVVGHLPFLEKLVGRLVVGDESRTVVTFYPATVVSLERTPEGSWYIVWMIRPELLE